MMRKTEVVKLVEAVDHLFKIRIDEANHSPRVHQVAWDGLYLANEDVKKVFEEERLRNLPDNVRSLKGKR